MTRMAEYIERDYVLKLLGVFNDRVNGDYHFMNGIETAKEIVEDAPSADVQPVKHGRWILDYGVPWNVIECSECGEKWHHWQGYAMPNFCSNCGADMRGE